MRSAASPALSIDPRVVYLNDNCAGFGPVNFIIEWAKDLALADRPQPIDKTA